jgi:methyl halide transferase
LSDKLDRHFWNEHYVNQHFPWDMGAISSPLEAYFNQLKNKDLRILIPGAGNAYEAEYLVKKGFTNVFVCDFASQALLNLQHRCPQIRKENLLHMDFFEIHQGQFDLVVEQTFFCALHPSLRRKYFEKMFELLSPGGKLVGVLFNEDLNSDKPPFGGRPEEYKSYFAALFKIKVFAACYNSIKPRKDRELFINLEK